jgi:hypothetical protein
VLKSRSQAAVAVLPVPPSSSLAPTRRTTQSSTSASGVATRTTLSPLRLSGMPAPAVVLSLLLKPLPRSLLRPPPRSLLRRTPRPLLPLCLLPRNPLPATRLLRTTLRTARAARLSVVAVLSARLFSAKSKEHMVWMIRGIETTIGWTFDVWPTFYIYTFFERCSRAALFYTCCWMRNTISIPNSSLPLRHILSL